MERKNDNRSQPQRGRQWLRLTAKWTHTRGRGVAGERFAAEWLRRAGLVIVDANVRTIAGEIDLIAHEGTTLCFIEVKARSSLVYGVAAEAVNAAKRQRLVRAAATYLVSHRHPGPCRFDIVAVEWREGHGWQVQHYRDAFRADSRTLYP